jgi:hypothetical protein
MSDQPGNLRHLHHLHHAGLVVRDIGRAMEVYRRLGFALTAPSFPAVSPAEGAPPRAAGAGNTHANFLRNFVEIVTVVRDGSAIPDDAELVPIQVPPAALPRVLDMINRTVGLIASRLERFEGLHILVLHTPDAESEAARLTAEGVGHSPVLSVQRRIDTAGGLQMVPARLLEIDEVPEGRLAVAENPAPETLRAQLHMDHPNGAVDLVEAVLCVGEAELAAFERRYQAYLGRPARADGPARVFDLNNSRVTLVPDVHLAAILPGETPPAVPAFVAYAVAVRDVGATRALLQQNRVPVSMSPSGDIFVPAAAAAGAAVIFRQAH